MRGAKKLGNIRTGKLRISSAPLCLTLAACWLIGGAFASPMSLRAKEKPARTYKIPLPPAPDFSPIDWVIGDWSGKTTDHDRQGDVHLSVAYDLERRVMVFRETISLPATKTIPGTNETWMGILCAVPATRFVLRVFSSTGFSTRFRVTTEEAEIRFTPEGGDQPPPEWLFRRTLVRTNADEMTETVQTAPPGKEFFVFYTAKLARAKTQPAKPD